MTEESITATSPAGVQFTVPCIPGKTSDGFHSFDELYWQRSILFAALLKNNPSRSWRSLKHHDGSNFEGWFIAGMILGEHQNKPITYHMPIGLWDILEGVPVLDLAFEWDGHTSGDVIERLTEWISSTTINSCSPIWETE